MNFARGGGFGRVREVQRPDLTPLIDIVFLLLIFFLLTTTFVKEKKPAVPIEVPEAASAETAPLHHQLTVHIARDGRIFIEDEELPDDAALEARLAKVKAENAKTRILLRADSEAQHGTVVRVMDLARQQGLTRFGIVSRRP